MLGSVGVKGPSISQVLPEDPCFSSLHFINPVDTEILKYEFLCFSLHLNRPWWLVVYYTHFERTQPPRIRLLPSKVKRTIFRFKNAVAERGICYMYEILGGGNSKIFYFHPENWGNDPI